MAAASLVAVVLVGAALVAGWQSRPGSLLGRVFGRGPFQQLAYDGPTDTPPVTWYFPATDTQNTLGYTWDEAQVRSARLAGPGKRVIFSLIPRASL